ncbi:MAG TPA: hypothetical protein DF911_00500 [Erysipelotrichaceae bacterium]|nr:hypothetical protein [Erysipelotrichaceae bacterium]
MDICHAPAAGWETVHTFFPSTTLRTGKTCSISSAFFNGTSRRILLPQAGQNAAAIFSFTATVPQKEQR